MPHRKDVRSVPIPGEILIDVVSTIVLALVFHYAFDMPWPLALLVAGPISILGWWCLLNLERGDSDGGSNSWISRLFDD